MAENLIILMKNINPQIQGIQQACGKVDSKKRAPGHTVLKDVEHPKLRRSWEQGKTKRAAS